MQITHLRHFSDNLVLEIFFVNLSDKKGQMRINKLIEEIKVLTHVYKINLLNTYIVSYLHTSYLPTLREQLQSRNIITKNYQKIMKIKTKRMHFNWQINAAECKNKSILMHNGTSV